MRTLTILIMLAFLWQILVMSLNIEQIILPSPVDVFISMTTNKAELIKNVFITMFEAVSGFALSAIVAYFAAVLFHIFPELHKTFFPLAIALKATPLIVLAPVLVLWFGNGYASKILMSSIICFYPILVNAIQGLREVDPRLIDIMRSMGASEMAILVRVRSVASLPCLFSGLKIASTLAIVGAIIGEFTGAKSGVGYVIKTAIYYLETEKVFAAIILTSISGVLFFYCLNTLQALVLFWEKNDIMGVVDEL